MVTRRGHGKVIEVAVGKRKRTEFPDGDERGHPRSDLTTAAPSSKEDDDQGEERGQDQPSHDKEDTSVGVLRGLLRRCRFLGTGEGFSGTCPCCSWSSRWTLNRLLWRAAVWGRSSFPQLRRILGLIGPRLHAVPAVVLPTYGARMTLVEFGGEDPFAASAAIYDLLPHV